MSEHHLTDEAKHLAGELVHEAEQEAEGTAALLTAERQPTLLEAMGGMLGILESALPSVAFVIAYSAGMSVRDAAVIAVGLAVVAAVLRVIRRTTPQFAIAGVIGVAISAWIATRTGEARNMFVIGLAANVVYTAAALGSIAVRRPLIGLIVGGFGEQGDAWRNDPAKYRAFRQATYLWASIFILRLVVQVPIYIADKAALLGTVKTAMGLPLFGVGVWLSWLILRSSGAVPGRPGGDTAADEPAASEPTTGTSPTS
jgi:Protein of unknown function (DUF3159)